MKKHLLLGSALFAAISAFPQQAVQKAKAASAHNMAAYLAQKFERQLTPFEPVTKAESKKDDAPAYGPENNPASAAKGAAVAVAPMWKTITKSANIYGNLVANSKPLTYNDNLHAVSFIHRKSPDYAVSPAPISQAESGVIAGMITNSWGNDWDTTVLWNSDDYWGRYPQGGTYNMPGRQCLDSAYMIATGPVTQINPNLGWVGSFFGVKQLDTMGGARNNNAISSVASHTIFAPNTNPTLFGKFDFPRTDFTVTDDGVVRSLGFLANNVNGTGSAYGWQGAVVVKGVFAGGSFIWTTDTIAPDVYVNSAGSQYVSGQPHMAWNESGTVGYVWFIGVREPRPGQGDTLSNMGYQPIIYKTTNSGATWTELPRINFNDTNGYYNRVFQQILAVRGSTNFGIPFFNLGEGVDGIVDRNDRLHIVSTVVGTFSKHPDSLGYTYLLTHNDGQRYNFGHENGLRPYIFDFTETNQGHWNVTLIDSMSSEAPGETAGTDGYDYNPWDAAGGTSGTDKVGADARIQLSRTPDGRYIIYTWAESDTGFTFQNYKWNQVPNVKARMAMVGAETSTAAAAGLTLHPTEINVTSPTSTNVPPYTALANHSVVADKAVMHYVSPKSAVISSTASSGVAIGMPVTVSNNNFVPFRQLQTINHWYLSANLNFDNVSSIDWPTRQCVATKPTTTVAVADLSQQLEESVIFPNPATDVAQLNISLAQSNAVDVTVLNAMGQIVQTIRHNGRAGKNEIMLDLNNYATGVYMVNIKVGDAMSTRKLMIQH